MVSLRLWFERISPFLPAPAKLRIHLSCEDFGVVSEVSPHDTKYLNDVGFRRRDPVLVNEVIDVYARNVVAKVDAVVDEVCIKGGACLLGQGSKSECSDDNKVDLHQHFQHHRFKGACRGIVCLTGLDSCV